MKAPYEELEFEVIRFTVEDIITTSNAQTDDDDKDQDQDQTDQDDQGGNEEDGGNDGNDDTGVIEEGGYKYYPTEKDYKGYTLYYRDGEDPSSPAWFKDDEGWKALG